ncbi:hypothetical protein ACFQMA_00785 [Halosimplex aquaticum]|uniref:Uncharacterized protein n=1 Tax=Halosimplex aquaticum TaxID=3026162 RepID=A0ABD5XZ37_9EURY|nr:hypothetical protein [Halosimplex aquaticum]
MPSFSRRRVLATGAAALLAGVAGCADSGGASTDTPTATERSFEHSVSDPAARTVRNDDGEPAVTSSARSTDESMLGTPTRMADEYWTVNDADERDALDFSGARTGAEAARTFAAETDLSTATLVVHQYYVEKCVTRRLERLRWGAAEQGPEGSAAIRLTYEDAERDGDCEQEGIGPIEATVFRIPEEIGQVTRFGYQV